jgi:undecaprenyl diphosphate synthase
MISECSIPNRISHFSDEEIVRLKKCPLPRHVAIIMDGNRRWAQKHCLGKMGGHWAGAHVLTQIVEAASDLDIKTLTVFAFSTENWERSPEEVNTLLKIFETYLEENCKNMIDHGIRFHVIGDLTPFSERFKKIIEKTGKDTQQGRGIDFVIALNYGGRDEICRVVKKIVNEMEAGRMSKEGIDEKSIARFVDTADFGDPDLLIRTSGERRISNFLLWQLAYAEVYVTETLWPDFTPRDLLIAVLDFQTRQRRNGK